MRPVLAAVLVISCVGAGCALQQAAPGGSLPQPEVLETAETDADRLLNYYAYMADLQGDALLQEYQRVQITYHADPGDFHRMQLVMLLSSPSASFRDTKLAQTLLKAWLSEDFNVYSKLYPLALLFENYLAELGRRDEAIARTGGELREANIQIEQQSKKIAKQQTELAAEKQLSSDLQKKLDALLEMEKNLIERQQKLEPDTP